MKRVLTFSGVIISAVALAEPKDSPRSFSTNETEEVKVSVQSTKVSNANVPPAEVKKVEKKTTQRLSSAWLREGPGAR